MPSFGLQLARGTLAVFVAERGGLRAELRGSSAALWVVGFWVGGTWQVVLVAGMLPGFRGQFVLICFAFVLLNGVGNRSDYYGRMPAMWSGATTRTLFVMTNQPDH